jgi:hypothetical protein
MALRVCFETRVTDESEVDIELEGIDNVVDVGGCAEEDKFTVCGEFYGGEDGLPRRLTDELQLWIYDSGMDEGSLRVRAPFKA